MKKQAMLLFAVVMLLTGATGFCAEDGRTSVKDKGTPQKGKGIPRCLGEKSTSEKCNKHPPKNKGTSEPGKVISDKNEKKNTSGNGAAPAKHKGSLERGTSERGMAVEPPAENGAAPAKHKDRLERGTSERGTSERGMAVEPPAEQ